MNGCTVYMHISPSNKIYIGITSKKVEQRWGRNGEGYKNNSYFWSAIQKYGWDNFEHKILFTNLTKEEAEEKEIELIKFFKSNVHDFGYNLAGGGYNNKVVSLETRKKLSDARKGSKLSEETKNKIGKFQRGRAKSEEHKRKIGDGNRGKKVSEESKEKMRHNNRTVSVICIDTMKIYYSINEASRQTGISDRSIIMCCKGKQKVAGNLKWLYLYDHKNKDGTVTKGAFSLGYIIEEDLKCVS